MPSATEKSIKNFIRQKASFQQVKQKAKKTLKKCYPKACTRRKVAYFCTRIQGEVLIKIWKFKS